MYKRQLQNSPGLTIELEGSAIPAYPGALELFERGISSTLAPSNRAGWRWLEGPVQLRDHASPALLELLVDPQTCGPLLLACTSKAAAQLTRNGPWLQIGNATACLLYTSDAADDLEKRLAVPPLPAELWLASSGPLQAMDRKLKPLQFQVVQAGYRCEERANDLSHARLLRCRSGAMGRSE